MGKTPEIVEGAEYLWGYFLELNASRWDGINGWLPISDQQIMAWCSLTGVRLRAWEYAALRAMDTRFVRGEQAVTEPEPMTASTFKSMFGKGK